MSLRNSPGKLLEAIIGDFIDNHFMRNIWMDAKQKWAFKKRHSPELLMLHRTKVWKEALDKGKELDSSS